MSIEENARRINVQKVNAANFSASGDPSQVVHDTNEQLIKTAELAAAWRTLGLTDEEGLALVARQQKLQPTVSRDEVVASLISAAQDLQSQGLGLVTADKYVDPNTVVQYGVDQADYQTVVAADLDSDGNVKDFGKKDRKRAIQDIKTRLNESNTKTRKPAGYYSPTLGRIVYNDGTLQGYVPQRALERRIEPRERLDAPPQQRVSTAPSLTQAQKSMLDAYRRLEAGFNDGSVPLTEENLSLFDRLEAKIFDDRAIQQEAQLVQELASKSGTPVNKEVARRNAEALMTPAELTLLDNVNSGLGNIGEVMIGPTGQKDYIREIGRRSYNAANAPTAEFNGSVHLDPSTGNPLAVQGPELPQTTVGNATQQLILDELYDYRLTDHTLPQTEIRAPIELFRDRVRSFSKWGTLQNAPTTVRGVTDLENALDAVISLGKEKGKAFYSMPDERGQTGPVSEPGPLEALKALGYNRPETTQLMNAIAQAQMYKNNQTNPQAEALVRQMYPWIQPGLQFDAPEQMSDFVVDQNVARSDNREAAGLFRKLTGVNIERGIDELGNDVDDRAKILNQAQQPFVGELSGRAARTPKNKRGQRPNEKAPIGGIQGNPNYRYDRLGISDLLDLQYASEQRDLRRAAKVQIPYRTDSTGRQVVPRVNRQVGSQTPREKQNTQSAMLAQARAQRDAAAPKALPPASTGLDPRDLFMAEQTRRNAQVSQLAESAERTELARLITEGPRYSSKGEFFRPTGSDIRVIQDDSTPLRPPLASRQPQVTQSTTSYTRSGNGSTEEISKEEFDRNYQAANDRYKDAPPPPSTPRKERQRRQSAGNYLPGSGQGASTRSNRKRNIMKGLAWPAAYAGALAGGYGLGQVIRDSQSNNQEAY